MYMGDRKYVNIYILAVNAINTHAERSSGRSPRLRTYHISRDSGWSRRTVVHRGRVFPSVRRPRNSGSKDRIVPDRRRTLVSGDIGIHGCSVAVRAQGLYTHTHTHYILLLYNMYDNMWDRG